MSDSSVSRFWDQCIEKTNAYRVRPAAVRWYVKHAEAYIKAYLAKRLGEHEPADLEAYLRAQGRDRRLRDWQFAQLVQALQVLFVDMVGTPWAAGFPWRHWMESARELEAEHPTTARDTGANSAALNPATDASRGRDKEQVLIRMFTEKFPQHVRSLVSEVRLRQYSIRTEKAYLAWLARFARHYEMQDPVTLTGDHIRAYLEHLVVRNCVSAST